MKLKEGFVLRQIGDCYVAVAVGLQTLDFKDMIRMNDVGAFLWEKLSKDCTKEQLVAAVTNEYQIDAQTASADIDSFLQSLKEADLLA